MDVLDTTILVLAVVFVYLCWVTYKPGRLAMFWRGAERFGQGGPPSGGGGGGPPSSGGSSGGPPSSSGSSNGAQGGSGGSPPQPCDGLPEGPEGDTCGDKCGECVDQFCSGKTGQELMACVQENDCRGKVQTCRQNAQAANATAQAANAAAQAAAAGSGNEKFGNYARW